MRRVVNVTWKHRAEVLQKHKTMSIAHKIKIELNLNNNYILEELKEHVVSAYVKSPDIEYFFKTSVVQLRYDNDKIIKEFCNDKCEKCIFWDFSKKIRDNGHRLNIYILTTSIIHKKSNEKYSSDSLASSAHSETENDDSKIKEMKRLQGTSDVSYNSIDDKVIANISWKHRASKTEKFQTMSMSHQVKINLDLNIEYTLDDLKNLIVTVCKKNSEARYFINSCLVQLGYGKDQIMNSRIKEVKIVPFGN